MTEDSKLLELSEMIQQTKKNIANACGMPFDALFGENSGSSLPGWNKAVDWEKAVKAFQSHELEMQIIQRILKNNWMPVIRLTTPAGRKLIYLLRTAKERGYISHRLAKRIRKVKDRI